MESNYPLGTEFASPDAQRAMIQIETLAAPAQSLTGSHPRNGQQPNYRFVGQGMQA